MKIVVLGLALAAPPATLSPLVLPRADGPVGFDDLRFSAELHKVLVPAGRTGRLDLIDPESKAIEAIAGFSESRERESGHGEGTTSADSGQGLIFASDRTPGRSSSRIAPRSGSSRARSSGVVPTTFAGWGRHARSGLRNLARRSSKPSVSMEAPRPRSRGQGRSTCPTALNPSRSIPTVGARTRTRGTTRTIAIDLASRRIVGRWKNGCHGSRGLALDARRGFVFVGCDEGRTAVLDANRDGKPIGRAPAGDGVDVLAYGATLSHLYVPGADAADLTVMGVGGDGTLEVLGKVSTARDAHCVTADDLGNVDVCDPAHGRLLTMHDPFPASGQRRSAHTGR